MRHQRGITNQTYRLVGLGHQTTEHTTQQGNKTEAKSKPTRRAHKKTHSPEIAKTSHHDPVSKKPQEIADRTAPKKSSSCETLRHGAAATPHSF
jgi:hypothetical protein